MLNYTLQHQISWADVDPAGIVFYPRYYEWINDSAHLLFDSASLNLLTLSRERNIQFGVVESGCRYYKPGKYGQKIIIRTEIEEVGAKTITFRSRIANLENDIVLAMAMEKRICIDVSNPERLKAMDIPDDILCILKKNPR